MFLRYAENASSRGSCIVHRAHLVDRRALGP